MSRLITAFVHTLALLKRVALDTVAKRWGSVWGGFLADDGSSMTVAARGICLLILTLYVTGCHSETTPPEAVPPPIDSITWYEVDPSWPRRPPQMKWGGTPAVSVDRQDRVWILTRTEPAVQVYSADGEYLFSWHDDTLRDVHGLAIDDGGDIWVHNCPVRS